MADEIQTANETQDGATASAATSVGTSYSAADAADWNGTAPTTIKEALDRLAAAAGPVT